jgi:hypothetical protein
MGRTCTIFLSSVIGGHDRALVKFLLMHKAPPLQSYLIFCLSMLKLSFQQIPKDTETEHEPTKVSGQETVFC